MPSVFCRKYLDAPMQLITPLMKSQLDASAELSRKKYAHCMLTKIVPVDALICNELGIAVEAKVTEALATVKPGVQVLAQVRLHEYLEALDAYGKPPKKKPKARDTKVDQDDVEQKQDPQD